MVSSWDPAQSLLEDAVFGAENVAAHCCKPACLPLDRQVTEESSDKTWSTGEEDGKPLGYSCLENPMNSMKRQNDRILKEKLPRSVRAQYATGDQWRNNSRKNEETEPKEKQHPVVAETGDGGKVQDVKNNIA